MSKSYFDLDKFTKIMTSREVDPYGTIIKFEQYFEQYSKDYSAYQYYCSELIKLGYIEKAEEVFNRIEEEYKLDDKYMAIDKKEILKPLLLYTKLKILSYSGRYEECLDICEKNFNTLHEDGISVNKLMLYCKKKLGILDITRKPEGVQTYSYNQIIEYQEEDFLNHIKKHLYEAINEDNFLKQSYFCKGFPIYKVIETLKEIIPNDKKLNNGLFDNVYYYKYDDCGTVNGKKVDYFEVITLDNSKEFITMYPADVGPKVPQQDLSYIVAEEDKVLKKSRVEKFNKKYGINVDSN